MAKKAPAISPELALELQQLKTQLGPAPLWTLAQRHSLGSALLKHSDRAESSHAQRYGNKLVDGLAKALEMDKGLLNKHMQFAASFSEAEVAKLSRVRLPNEEPLSWSHARLLMEVTDKRQRRRLIKRVAEDGWTSARLAAAVREVKGEKAHGGGPRPVAPKSLIELVQQMNQMLSAWENRHQKVWGCEEYSLAALAQALPRRQADEETIEKVAALREAWSGAAARCQEMVKAAEQAIDRLRGKVSGGAPEPGRARG